VSFLDRLPLPFLDQILWLFNPTKLFFFHFIVSADFPQ